MGQRTGQEKFEKWCAARLPASPRRKSNRPGFPQPANEALNADASHLGLPQTQGYLKCAGERPSAALKPPNPGKVAPLVARPFASPAPAYPVGSRVCGGCAVPWVGVWV